jgi:asparagine synthase (glutamine-hydrolysing)
MCGIVGAAGGDPGDRRRRLETAVLALGHRGPDGHGVHITASVALAHTRLAVIDVSHASDQPMTDEATGCTLVFNGEIYNYRELRPELEGKGHRFRSAGDTEVLLRAYLEWGDACVDHLNGMFAFAVHDPRDESIFLARDRLGEKPLHLTTHGRVTWFASEIKALLAAGVASARPNLPYLQLFLAHGDLGHPEWTPLDGVRQLPAGHAARLDRDGGLRSWSYWELPSAPAPSSAAAVDEEFAQLFDDSVRLRLRSDVPLGTSLSGGLDSSLVLATVRAHRPDGELHAFTASFPGTDADELDLAKAVAASVGATIHPVRLGAGDLEADLDSMIRANEGPVESPSTLAQYRVMREAHSAGITVLLDGQGADETWAGYEKYASDHLFDRALTGHLVDAARWRAAWRSTRDADLSLTPATYLGVAVGASVRRRLAGTERRRTAKWLDPGWALTHDGTDPIGDARAVMPGRVSDAHARADLTRVTLPRLLRYADRNSMAWSREVRLPFLDHRLVELAARTPVTMKVRDGWTKEPVRRALERLGVPEVARRRDKRAYMPPTASWLADERVARRVRRAWASLRSAGILIPPAPVDAVLPRWRVLAVHAWAEAFGVSLV